MCDVATGFMSSFCCASLPQTRVCELAVRFELHSIAPQTGVGKPAGRLELHNVAPQSGVTTNRFGVTSNIKFVVCGCI